MKSFLRKLIAGVIGILVSAILILSLPSLKYWFEHRHSKDEQRRTAVTLKKVEMKQNKEEQKPHNTPKHVNSNQRNIKSGPRFGIDLGVMGAGGAAVPQDLVAKSGGGANMGLAQGDVDEKPELLGSLALDLPRSIRESQSNAALSLRFCVDGSGHVFNISVQQEKPSGQGLADAGRRALAQATFKVAKKGGKSVPYCGVEQEFQVNFND